MIVSLNINECEIKDEEPDLSEFEDDAEKPEPEEDEDAPVREHSLL